MARPSADASERPASATRLLPLLVLLFIGSGAAALIYEVVWFQMLSLIIGSSSVSLGVLLATFMGGMAAGSLGLSRFVSMRVHPLRVYAWLEVGIGLLGGVVLLVLPYAGGLYLAIGGPGTAGLLVRALLCALCLLPPTILMGATLPAIARWVESTPHGVSWLGFLYGGNIAGAVAGSLLAGFYLLRVYDVVTATLAAVAINAIVAAAGFALARMTAYEERSPVRREQSHEPVSALSARDPRTPPASQGTLAARRSPSVQPMTPPVPSAVSGASWPVLVAITISGMTALAAEVVWTRLLTLTLGGTVYTFSLILAAFLAGLGLGSGVGAALARSVRDPRTALGVCQLLLIGGIAWAAFWLTRALPYWPIDPWLSPGPAVTFQIDFVRCLLTVLPPAMLWGASFPLALAAMARRGDDPGRLVGRVYAANTAGAIAGALLASLLVVAWAGTQQAQRILIGLSAVSAVLLLAPVITHEGGKLVLELRTIWRAPATIALAVLLGASVAPVPGLLVAYGRYTPARRDNHGDIIYVGEGMSSSLAVSRLSSGVLNYHNAGKVQASSEPQDMRLQRMLGHLTTLVPQSPRSVFVIGLGAGVTAGAVSIDPAVERVTIAELEPLVPRVVSQYFSEHNFGVVANPKVQVEIDDGRHFLLTTGETFDAITSDPFDPWVKGAATLYTREFFELAKRKLNPGGVITVFVQLYESTTDAVKSELATFFDVFPEGIVVGNPQDGTTGYDIVLLGMKEPRPIDLDAVDERLRRPEYAPIVRSMREIGMFRTEDLFATFAGRAADLRPWLADAQLNRDRNLRLQYLAGLGLNLYEQDAIYRELLAYRTVPDDLFTGAPERVNELREAIEWY